MGKAGEGRDEGKYCGCGGRRAGGHRGPPLQTTYVTRRRGRPLCRPVVGVCTSVVPLIRHGLRPRHLPYPFCPFGTFPLDKGNRPQGKALGTGVTDRRVGPSDLLAMTSLDRNIIVLL